MSTLKKAIFATTVLVFVLTVGFFGLEMWLRAQHTTWDPNGIDSGPRAHRECYRLSFTTGYEPIPNKCKRDEKGFYRTWTGASDSDALKILVFGDSIADQHLWVQQMSESLSKSVSQNVQTKNAGTPGFDTCTELQMFKDKGVEEDFDILLLQFCPNDLATTATIIPLSNNRVRFFIGFEYVEFPKWVLSSRIATWIAIQTLNRQTAENGNRSSIEPIAQCLQEFKELSEDMGVEMRIVLFPSFYDDIEDPTPVFSIKDTMYNTQMAEETSRRFLEESKIPFIEIRSIFEQDNLSLEAHRNSSNDIWHPNNEGQIRIGNALSTWMQKDLPSISNHE